MEVKRVRQRKRQTEKKDMKRRDEKDGERTEFRIKNICVRYTHFRAGKFEYGVTPKYKLNPLKTFLKTYFDFK